MATSSYQTTQYFSDQFVESCGAVLFDLSQHPRQVCLVHYTKTGEWFLPKGRRNCGESRREAALREVQEETGYRCRIHPVTMPTRAPRPDDAENVPDEARLWAGLDEPFMLTVRELDGTPNVKIIWWFIAGVDDDSSGVVGSGDFRADFFDYGEALLKLTFQKDRDILAKAFALVEGSSLS